MNHYTRENHQLFHGMLPNYPALDISTFSKYETQYTLSEGTHTPAYILASALRCENTEQCDKLVLSLFKFQNENPIVGLILSIGATAVLGDGIQIFVGSQKEGMDAGSYTLNTQTVTIDYDSYCNPALIHELACLANSKFPIEFSSHTFSAQVIVPHLQAMAKAHNLDPTTILEKAYGPSPHRLGVWELAALSTYHAANVGKAVYAMAADDNSKGISPKGTDDAGIFFRRLCENYKLPGGLHFRDDSFAYEFLVGGWELLRAQMLPSEPLWVVFNKWLHEDYPAILRSIVSNSEHCHKIGGLDLGITCQPLLSGSIIITLTEEL